MIMKLSLKTVISVILLSTMIIESASAGNGINQDSMVLLATAFIFLLIVIGIIAMVSIVRTLSKIYIKTSQQNKLENKK